jgi:hypothetical protein
MKIILLLLSLVLTTSLWAQGSMRRCTLLPITDSVGGAMGFKVFQELETHLKRSNWCTYVSNSSLLGVFGRYRENLPQYLKTKEVLATVAERLKVGSMLRIAMVSELKGVELQMDIYGDNGEDLYFSEKTLLQKDDLDLIAATIKGWLDVYERMIPYDARITGVLGDQITLDVGKGYPIKIGQRLVVKRALRKIKHPLLNKIVDWEMEVLAEGTVFNISDNQALGMIKVYRTGKRLEPGDWVRLEEVREAAVVPLTEAVEETPGTLGILSVALFGTSSSVDTATTAGLNRMSGTMFGFDFRAEGWITRQYFAALEITRSLGGLARTSGAPEKDRINGNNGVFKMLGGYKYLPIGFFYGPQIDIYGGYANYSFDLNYSAQDGFGRNTFKGAMFGTAANIPINREYRFFAKAEFIPFPSFEDQDGLFGKLSSASTMELEAGLRYYYTLRMSFDGSIETVSNKAKFQSNNREVSYRDNRLKLGVSFNF